ncbi:MAG: hypothetical protein U0X76_01705 [Bacteroidia bacterium]
MNLIVNVKAINYTIGGTGVMTMTKKQEQELCLAFELCACWYNEF